MSGGLVKACVPGKNCSVPEKLEFLIQLRCFLPNKMALLEVLTTKLLKYIEDIKVDAQV